MHPLMHTSEIVPLSNAINSISRILKIPACVPQVSIPLQIYLRSLTSVDTTAEDTSAENIAAKYTTEEDTTAEGTAAEDTSAENIAAKYTTEEDTTAEGTAATSNGTSAENTATMKWLVWTCQEKGLLAALLASTLHKGRTAREMALYMARVNWCFDWCDSIR